MKQTHKKIPPWGGGVGGHDPLRSILSCAQTIEIEITQSENEVKWSGHKERPQKLNFGICDWFNRF